VSETPTDIEGRPRQVDDMQPTAQFKLAHEKKAISQDDAESVKQFCKKYIV
jgi:hypothetical protein